MGSNSDDSSTAVWQSFEIVIPSKHEDFLKLVAEESSPDGGGIPKQETVSEPWLKSSHACGLRVPCIGHPRHAVSSCGSLVLTNAIPLCFNSVSSLKALGDVLSHDVYGAIGELPYSEEYRSTSRRVYRFLYRVTSSACSSGRKRRFIEYGRDSEHSAYERQCYWSKLNCWERVWNCNSLNELQQSLCNYSIARSPACFTGDYAAQRTLKELDTTLEDCSTAPAYLSSYAHHKTKEDCGKFVWPTEPHICTFHASAVFPRYAKTSSKRCSRLLVGAHCRATPDLLGCKKFMFLIVMRRELIVANAWISTLGGGYYLCKHIDQARVMAEKQILVAKLLGDESMEAKANVHFVYNDILERKFGSARVRIRTLRKIGKRLGDTELLKMLKASKLYCNKVEELDKTGILHKSKRASGQSHPLLPQTEDSYESDLPLSDDFYRQRPIV
eukprot:gb/GECG01008064.1/.p1 GENE.gb/GECG01008064.1/~~gb/GECG01008064.1/.p1  ORF type:complete len:443 (+),score=32.80 gb/GECG01008064.1/:1-1329(+)